MCLTRLDKKTYKCRVGYKIFDESIIGEKCFYSPYYPKYLMKIGRTYIDRKNNFIWFDPKVRYETGFHFYLDKETALNWCYHPHQVVIKIKVKKVVATGYQGKLRVGVAKEITLLEVVK